MAHQNSALDIPPAMRKTRPGGRRARTDKTLARTQRALEILRLLQSGQPWSAGELSERFGCSSRTISRDVQLLRECGVAIAARGGEKGLRLAHDFFWQPVRPTVEEMTALVVGTRLAARGLPKGLAIRLEAVVEKLLGAAEPATRNQLTQLVWRIDAPHLARIPALPKWDFLPELLDSLLVQSTVRCVLAPGGPDQSDEVVLVPERLTGASGDWLLLGNSKDGMRVSVAIDRIIRVEPIGENSEQSIGELVPDGERGLSAP